MTQLLGFSIITVKTHSYPMPAPQPADHKVFQTSIWINWLSNDLFQWSWPYSSSGAQAISIICMHSLCCNQNCFTMAIACGFNSRVDSIKHSLFYNHGPITVMALSYPIPVSHCEIKNVLNKNILFIWPH